MSRKTTTFSITDQNDKDLDELLYILKQQDKKINSRSKVISHMIEKTIKELKQEDK